MSSLFFGQCRGAVMNSFKYRNIIAAKMSTKSNFETISVTVPKPFVYHVELNRPNQLNAQTRTMWLEIGKCFEDLHLDSDCRVIILSGAGKIFSAGLDFKEAMRFGEEMAEHEDVARKGKVMRSFIDLIQRSFTSLERCNKPVLAAVHSACIGAGVDLITGADIRYCTKDAWFQVKEVLIGMAADVGTLQRLPKVVGSEGLTRELCYTGRKFDAAEAKSFGLITRIYEDKESMMKGVMEVAEQIAANSPVAVQVSKNSLVYSRDHSVQEGLDHIATWNQMMLQSEDFITGVTALATKDTNVVYSKL